MPPRPQGPGEREGREGRAAGQAAELRALSLRPRPQALPYVALLIVMLFFIYAVIGMQVRGGRRASGGRAGVRAGWTLPPPGLLAALGSAAGPEKEVVPRQRSVSQAEAARGVEAGRLCGRTDKGQIALQGPIGGSGGLSRALPTLTD